MPYNPGKGYRFNNGWNPNRTTVINGKKITRPHNGDDWSANIGTAIPAAYSGVVVASAFQKGGAGNYIKIEHDVNGEKVQTLYMHMNDLSHLKIGDPVKKGETVGYVGNTGRSSGPHLHFEIRKKIGKAFVATNARKFVWPDVGDTQEISTKDSKKTISKEDNKSNEPQVYNTKNLGLFGPLKKVQNKKFSHFQQAAAQTTYGATMWAAEGGGSLDVVNDSGYAGKYQMGNREVASTAKKLGYMGKTERWTGKNGIKNKNDWLKSSAVQDEFLKEYTKNNWNILNRLVGKDNLKKLIGKKIGGLTITESGLLSAAHLVGPASVARFLNTAGKEVAIDGYGTKMTNYMAMGANKNVSEITGNPFNIYDDVGKFTSVEGGRYYIPKSKAPNGRDYTLTYKGKRVTPKEDVDMRPAQAIARERMGVPANGSGSTVSTGAPSLSNAIGPVVQETITQIGNALPLPKLDSAPKTSTQPVKTASSTGTVKKAAVKVPPVTPAQDAVVPDAVMVVPPSSPLNDLTVVIAQLREAVAELTAVCRLPIKIEVMNGEIHASVEKEMQRQETRQ